MGKKAGFIDVDDEEFKKKGRGMEQVIEDSKAMKGSNKQEKLERQQEKAMKAMQKRSKTREVEKGSWKQKAGGLFFIIFMCGVGLFSFLSTVWGFVVGSGVVNVDVQDTTKLKNVLFGGEPWLIYCVNSDTVNYPLPRVVEDSAWTLWSNLRVSVGVLHCWDKTESGRSVAQRFKMNLKPPLAFVVANGNKPRSLNLAGISKTEDLEKRIKPALSLEIPRIDTLKKWPSLCTSRRSCVVVGHKHQAQKTTALNVLQPLHEKYRALKIVTLDTAFWQLKLEESVMATRKSKGTADVLCLTREEKPGSNATYGGFFLPSLDSSSASSFLQACSDHTGAIEIKAAPRIKARPSKPKKATPAPVPPSRPSKPSPPPPSRKTANVDQVGSRSALETEEEPLFEAVEEGDEEEGSEEEEEDDSGDDEVEL
eukprot:TRINITY_DN51630_c0_g1_i1.p1 TRINITY_DN51630_c0_g1~~TRINITY_DN51630_c0_g1_i1.p1  ORF type:complete len:424 (-),score=105.01 TRINITY_DN51630_c0_g1_i1:33-1304(-)